MRIGEGVLHRAARNGVDRGGANEDGDWEPSFRCSPDRWSLNRLREDLLGIPTEVEEPDVTDDASLEFEVERMGKRLAVWKIFLGYLREGARSWSEVRQGLTKEDFEKLPSTCDGVPLRDLLLDLR